MSNYDYEVPIEDGRDSRHAGAGHLSGGFAVLLPDPGPQGRPVAVGADGCPAVDGGDDVGVLQAGDGPHLDDEAVQHPGVLVVVLRSTLMATTRRMSRFSALKRTPMPPAPMRSSTR